MVQSINQKMAKYFVYTRTWGQQLLKRDQLMKEGTEHWMTEFMTSQADYYKEAIYNANNAKTSFNKEEKALSGEQLGSMNVTEEWEQFGNLKMKFVKEGKILQKGVYWRQGAGVGGAPCTEATSYNPFDNTPGCGTYISDLNKQINR